MAERHCIGVVGNGYVGSAIAAAFAHTCYIKVYDVNPMRSEHTLEELCIEAEYIFVCVPTPTSSDGTQDLACITKAVQDIADYCDKVDSAPVVIIKSTVLQGTSRELSVKTGLEIVFSPEFLTARTAMQDFANPDRIIFGCSDARVGYELIRLFKERFPTANYVITSIDEAEFIKYMVNAFFATKIIFMNTMRSFSSKHLYNWNKCLEGFASDHRIANSHLEVPGHDKRPGFGGACLPKDLKALVSIFKKTGVNNELLKTVDKINGTYREDK